MTPFLAILAIAAYLYMWAAFETGSEYRKYGAGFWLVGTVCVYFIGALTWN